uniref:RNase H type-1 domain-containing protein n=1 Tax=Nelumbo nucifera TaxID=4432 RepID=A0A822ZLA2_NELNU|nr:TPA_asm: hypothetical protein HUJ06_004192 [Nelumbo nucifera]
MEHNVSEPLSVVFATNAKLDGISSNISRQLDTDSFQILVLRYIKWVKPLANTLKLNFNGALNNVSGGISFLLRDSEGSFCFGRALKSSLGTPLEVETRAALEALKFTVDLGVSSLIVEGDSYTIIKVMFGLKENVGSKQLLLIANSSHKSLTARYYGSLKIVTKLYTSN